MAGASGAGVADGVFRSASSFGVLHVFGISLALFAIGFAVALAAHWSVPRLMRLMLVPGKVYPLYGPRYYAAQTLSLFGHAAGFQTLFGDSSAIVHYFNWVGMRQPDVKQTGSNFGTAMGYDSPFEVEIGSGSMISDAVSYTHLTLPTTPYV